MTFSDNGQAVQPLERVEDLVAGPAGWVKGCSVKETPVPRDTIGGPTDEEQ